MKNVGFRKKAVFTTLLLFSSSAAWSQTTTCGIPDSRFGLNFDDKQQPLSVVSTAMGKIADTNVGTVRLWVWWKSMEATQGTIDFTYLDNRVNAAYSAGLQVLLTFASVPSWANGSSPSCDFWAGQCSAPPTSPSFFQNFAYAVANRYKSKVSSYELWNEPDHHVFWNSSMSLLNSRIVQPGSASIRSADPSATIVSPSFYTSRSKLTSLLAQSCSAHDVVGVHSYDGSAAQMKSKVNGKWTSAMNDAGCRQRIWVTEFGIDSATVGESTQANEYAQGVTLLLNGSMKADRLIIYRLEDHQGASSLAYGVTRQAPSYIEKLSYSSLQSVVPTWCVTTYP